MSTPYTSQIAAFTLVLFAWLPAIALGQQQVDAERALELLPEREWYDTQRQSYVPPEITPVHDSEIRRTGWLAESPANGPASAKPSWWDWNLPSISAEWFSLVFLWTCGLILAVIVGMLSYHALRSYLPSRVEKRKSSQGIDIDPTRISDLPFDVARTSGNPLDEARRLMQAGHFDAAMVQLYGYMLLAMDRARAIHLQKGKTNRMYLRELRYGSMLAQIVELSMHRFEDVFFGRLSLTRENFMEVWERLDDFHLQLANATRTVAVEPAHDRTASSAVSS